MPDLVSMRLSPQEREAKYSETVAADRPTYPYGLAIRLEAEQLEKLGIDLPKVGAAVRLEARAEVVSISAHESAEGGKFREASLQITDLAIEHDASDSIAERLYKA